MKSTTKLVIALWAMFVAHTAFSQKGTEQQLEKEANTFFNKGEYLKAFPMFSQLVSLYPNHPDYNYKFGACAIYSEADKTKAVKFLTIATLKGVEDPMAWYYLGKAYHLNYQFRESIQSYESFLRKADPKVSAKTDAQREIETCIYGSNLLANIKDITVINKTEADRESFFRYFNLEKIGGKILTVPEELKTKLDQKATEPGVIHFPGSGTTIYFSSYGKEGKTGKDIYKAQILPDGKFSEPVALKGDVNTKYDEDYCFMHSDGKTLYFASKGHNSMGGYDIFKCELDSKTGQFGPAINLDFAINTPDDDIFFIADSLNKRAYFASGRTSDQKHLHVYNVLVETTPLQIIYLKGEFISEINPEHKKAAVKITEQMSGRAVMEANTNTGNGNYVLYVPGAGEYTFKVLTENSATVHEIKVNVPKFDKPVALRQEMRLISEAGKDKLIVTNYFETPLNEDLSALAADMLRKKAGLDVNTTPDNLSSSSSPISTTESNISSVEKTIANAPIIAGFADGTTVQSVVKSIEKDIADINNFVNESDKKYANAYSFAQKKLNEAEASLKKAELLRSQTSTYATQDDVNKLRESIALIDAAKALQKEAQSAIVAAEAVKQYKESESQKAIDLQGQSTFLKQAESTQNFDAALQGLQKERQRQSDIKSDNSGTPLSEMLAKAKAKESEQHKAEQKLTLLRSDEKDLVTQLKLADDQKKSATKKKDKEAAETNYVNIQSQLDVARRDIVNQDTKTNKLGEEAKDFYSNANMFQNLSANTTLGLAENECTTLTDTDKTAMAMKLSQMDERMNVLEVKDPQMLALITDASSNTYVNNSSAAATNVQVKSRDALIIKSDYTILKTKSSSPSTKHMFAASSMAETNASIRELEAKKNASTLNPTEQQDLNALIALRTNLQNEMIASPIVTSSTNTEGLRATYISVEPSYNEQITSINNSKGSEIDHTIQIIKYKQNTLDKLLVARYNNAQQAALETDSNALNAMAMRDQQYETAIKQLSNETSDVNLYKAAYETENKSIIESDAIFAGKLQEQISITESYITALEEVEKEKQSKLNSTSDSNEVNALSMQLADIALEKTTAEKKLDNYRNDLSLTAATADPKMDNTNVAVNTNLVTKPNPSISLEEAIVKNEKVWDLDSPVVNEGDPQKTQAQMDTEKTEKIFKVREQPESIFAYESGSFEEIVAQHTKANTELRHRDKIQSINDEIFLVEAEMENEKGEAKLRKLDYRAEQLYLRRSLIEIDNSSAIAIMAQEEYEQEKRKSDEMTIANQEKIDGRAMLRDEITNLERQAKSNMQEAATLREIAPSKQDDIERADFYREAFAKESLAIDQLQQIQNINENIDMMLTYDDQQLTNMRSGKSPDAELLATLKTEEDARLAEQTRLAEVTSMKEKSEAEMQSSNSVAKEEVTAENVTTPSSIETIADTKAQITNSDTAEKTAVEKTVTDPIVAKQPWDKNVVYDKKTVNAYYNTEGALIEQPVNAENKSNVAEPATKKDELEIKVTPLPDGLSNSSETTASAKANVPAKPIATSYKNEGYDAASSAAGAYSGYEAEAYYFSAPEVLEKDLFVITSRAVYSESKPIPMNMEMPKGVYFKVQVGAFRNNIPQNLYDEFAPISGETLNSGITRYTAGFFKTFENADKTKKDIRVMGYGDAFVVAFRDGKRIPLYEAMGKSASDFQASIEKEYVYGDKGTAPKSTNTNANSAASTSAKTNYYSNYPDAAKASQVEEIKGLFFTVQVGVYSRPVSSKSIFYINPLNSEQIDGSRIRYTSGRFSNLNDAVEKRNEAKTIGIKDAFVTAYYNGKKITLSEADKLLKENGPSILAPN